MTLFQLACGGSPSSSASAASGAAPALDPLGGGGVSDKQGSDNSGGVAGASAGSSGAKLAAVCAVHLPSVCPSPAPSYADVEPIFAERCATCHSGAANGPWPLTTYGHVATWRDTIRAALATCAMPPPDSGLVILADESSRILDWIRCGMPI